MHEDDFYILTINPGSMSTKVGYYHNEECLLEEEVMHKPEELSALADLDEEYSYRQKLILKILAERGMDLSRLDAVVGRGGFMKPVEGGTYLVDEHMLADIRKSPYRHPCNLGAPLAWQISKELSIPAYIVDPVVVDEICDLARISGTPDIVRQSFFHALNIRAVAHIAAEKLIQKYSDLNMIVCHLGGGISITAHEKGRVIDVNNALLGMGPFTPRRVGALPTYDLIRYVLSSGLDEDALFNKFIKESGLYAYLGTDSGLEIKKMIERGDKKARFIFEAMAYQIAKEIGGMASTLRGRVHLIVFSGGLSRSDILMYWVGERVSWIAPCIFIPGQKELDAMAAGALKVLIGYEKVKRYTPREEWSVELAVKRMK